MPYQVVFAPEAQEDLRELYRYIAERGGPERALAYIERVQVFCRSFAEFPLRGHLRDDLQQGMRVTGFERRVTVVFHVGRSAVTFDRFLYGGRVLRRPGEKSAKAP